MAAAALRAGSGLPDSRHSRLHHSLPEGTLKRRVGECLECQTVEIVILLLVFCDMALVTVEVGIDDHLLCVSGQVVRGAGPEQLAGLGRRLEECPMGCSAQHCRSGGHDEGGGQGLAHGRVCTAYCSSPGREDASGFCGAGPAYRGVGSLDCRGCAEEPGQLQQRERPARRLGRQRHLLGATLPLQLLQLQLQRTSAKAPHGPASVDAHGRPHREGGGEAAGHEHAHPEQVLICETRHGPLAHAVAHHCHLWSIAILVVFLVELFVKIWLTPSEFFRSRFEVLDLVVVSVSLLVDVLLLVMQEIEEHQAQAEEVGNSRFFLEVAFVPLVLVALRCWRIVRIVHAGVELMHKKHEEMEELAGKLREAQDRTRALERIGAS